MSANSPSLSYATAGVDIDAGNALVERIKPLAKATTRAGVLGGLGGFGALFDVKALGMKDPLLVSGTDGVGTKLKIAQITGRHDTIGIDLVAMCVNDLIVQGAQPLFFLDYFATGKLSVDEAASVIAGIAEGCKQSDCALIGGETAEMPGMYGAGEYDLAGFCVGAVERDAVLPQPTIGAGDVVLGLASSGAHSNGYSLVRKVMEAAGAKYDDACPFATGKTFADVWLTPTRIYVKNLIKAFGAGGIKGLAHITGGGVVENLPRVLPEKIMAEIDAKSWPQPAWFQWLQEKGNVPAEDMWRTFNAGIGMALVVDAARADAIEAMLKADGETVYRIGKLYASDRVKSHVVMKGL